MPDWKAALTKKIGPLPAWGWGAVVGGGYLGYRMLSGKGISLSGATSAATDAASDNGTGVSGTGSVGPGDGGGVAPTPADGNALLAALTAEVTRGDKAVAGESKSNILSAKRKAQATYWAKVAKKLKAAAASNAKRSNNKKPTSKRTGTTQAGHKATKLVTPLHRSVAASAAPQRVRNRAPKVTPKARVRTTNAGRSIGGRKTK